MVRLLLLTAVLAFGQTPSFEVAAIKPANPNSRLQRVQLQPSGRLLAENVSLRTLIEDAYQILPLQLTGGPKWLDYRKFSINATANESVTGDQMRIMLRTLLKQRFALTMHTETKDVSLSLLAVKDPEKVAKQLTLSEGGKPEYLLVTGGRGELTTKVVFRKHSMADFAKVLSRQMGRVVEDQTGLSEEFDFSFEASRTEGDPDPFNITLAPSLGDLGLKLESRKGPTQIYVIDRAELPSEN
jgi:uncharacterized protein (TIGR03435 family)